jgi:hypothetical protein
MYNGRFIAALDGGWALMNDDKVISRKYSSLKLIDKEKLIYEFSTLDGKYGFIDTKGAVLLPLTYDDCETRFSKTWYKDERRILPIWVKCGDKCGFVDMDGNIVIQPKYEHTLPFTVIGEKQVLAAVALNGAVGFINQSGENVIPFIYDVDFDNRYNYAFYGGFANVRHGGKWGVIDVENNIVINFLYDGFIENRNAGFRYALRDGKKWSIDTKGNEWEMKKNPAARTFKDYLYATDWEEVAKSFRTLIGLDEENPENELKVRELNFNTFKNKTFKPSENIIRIHACYADEECDWERPPVEAHLYSVRDNCSYAIFDWDEILNMEVRIEDNLTLTDADIVAVCIWEACDQAFFSTEESIKTFLNKLDEQTKTMDENRRDYGKPCETDQKSLL